MGRQPLELASAKQILSTHAFEPGQRLEGWKQIAAYLKRDVRTIQRWERAEQFPVRRQMHRKLGERARVQG